MSWKRARRTSMAFLRLFWISSWMLTCNQKLMGSPSWSSKSFLAPSPSLGISSAVWTSWISIGPVCEEQSAAMVSRTGLNHLAQTCKSSLPWRTGPMQSC